MMQVRDRIKELRRVKASELLPNPKNWRTHPAAQADALRGVLAEIGYADALIAYEPNGDGRLMLIDGHLRADTTPDQEVPVLVLDVTEEEADKLLLTLDPLAAMAGAGEAELGALLASVETDNEALQELLAGMADEAGAVTVDNPQAEWEGMPKFEQEDKTAFRSIIVHFKDKEAVDEFNELVKPTITDKTKMIWFPNIEIESYQDKQYADKS